MSFKKNCFTFVLEKGVWGDGALIGWFSPWPVKELGLPSLCDNASNVGVWTGCESGLQRLQDSADFLILWAGKLRNEVYVRTRKIIVVNVNWPLKTFSLHYFYATPHFDPAPQHPQTTAGILFIAVNWPRPGSPCQHFSFIESFVVYP